MSSAFVLRVFVDPPVDPTIDGSIKKIAAEEIIQLNILNACDIPNLAGIARKYMRIRGFDVVEIGNHPDFSDKSFVIDRVGDLSSAKKVAYAFGISDSLIVQHIDSSLFLRSSVVIGKDFKNLRPFEE